MNNIFRRVLNVVHYMTKALASEAYWFKRNIKYSMLYRGEEYLANRLLVMGHSVEKGITMPNRHLGFGQNAVRLLIASCNEYIGRYGTSSSQLQIALDDLKEYEKLHQANNFQLPRDIATSIEALMKYKTTKDELCKEFSKDEFFSYTDFYSFAHSRHTCRWFSNEEVTNEEIRKAIELANTAPSACNRQSVRVKCVSGHIKDEILNLQNGNRGFGDKINKLLVVTYTQPSFEYDIQSAGYFDAGIYTMNILYALHYYHLCACTLNAHFEKVKMEQLRNILGLNPCEVPTVFIAVGKPLEQMMIAKSERIDVKDVLSFSI